MPKPVIVRYKIAGSVLLGQQQVVIAPVKETLLDTDTLDEDSEGETLLGEMLLGETLEGEMLLGETLEDETLLGEILLGEMLRDETLDGEKLLGETLRDEILAEAPGLAETPPLAEAPLAEAPLAEPIAEAAEGPADGEVSDGDGLGPGGMNGPAPVQHSKLIA